MANTNEWDEFFNGHAPDYMQNCFTTSTAEEIKFLLEELKLPRLAGPSVSARAHFA